MRKSMNDNICSAFAELCTENKENMLNSVQKILRTRKARVQNEVEFCTENIENQVLFVNGETAMLSK